MADDAGIEPATHNLTGCHSTNWVNRPNLGNKKAQSVKTEPVIGGTGGIGTRNI